VETLTSSLYFSAHFLPQEDIYGPDDAKVRKIYSILAPKIHSVLVQLYTNSAIYWFKQAKIIWQAALAPCVVHRVRPDFDTG
jgi:hypothetical protein